MSKQPIMNMESSMLIKSMITGLFLGIAALLPLEAAAITVLVMETGMSEENQSRQYSTVWENNLLEALFDMGHIVSNSPTIRIQVMDIPANGLPADAQRDFDEAQDGGMDYFIVAIVDYKSPRVSLRLFSTKSSEMILERAYTVATFRNTKDELENIKKAAMTMAAHIK